MDSKVTFDMFKHIIIEQNKLLLKEVAQVLGKDEESLLNTYIKPDYYLPVIIKTVQSDLKANDLKSSDLKSKK